MSEITKKPKGIRSEIYEETTGIRSKNTKKHMYV